MIKKFLDLGYQPPSDQFKFKNQINEPTEYYPLKVNQCITTKYALVVVF